MANETNNIEFTRLFNDYILSNQVPSITYDTGTIKYGDNNPNNLINTAINKITIDDEYDSIDSLKLVKTASANITYGWSIANNGLFRQYIYEYEIKRHPDIDFKTIALQITGTENMARLIYDKKLLHSILGESRFNETYDVSKNGWLMALANPNKWFKEFIEHNKGTNSFTYETEISGNISQIGDGDILSPIYIFDNSDKSYKQITSIGEIINRYWDSKDFYQTADGSIKYIKKHEGTEYKLILEDGSIGFIGLNQINILKPVYIYDDTDHSYIPLEKTYDIINNWNTKRFYQTANDSIKYKKEHNGTEYKLISEKDGSIGFISDTSIQNPKVNYYKPTYHIIGVGPLINKTNNILNGKDFNDYWCNNKLVLYMYMYDEQITELENIINTVSGIELVKLYNETTETGMVSSLNVQTQLTNKINNHHEIVDNKSVTWSENSYTSTGATFSNLNIYNGTGFGEQSYKTGDPIINTYAPESSRYINNLSVVYNKPCGSNPGNHIFGPETVYRIDYDSIKNKTITESSTESDYQITFGETIEPKSGSRSLPALPIKSFKHKFGKPASSQILAGTTGVAFNTVAKAEDSKVYIISRLSLLPVNNMEFYEGHNKLYVNVGWYNKMYNILKEYYKDGNDDSYITPTFANANYIPLEILPVYDWTANNYYWELNYSGNTILTFNEGSSINLTHKDPTASIDIDLNTINANKRSEYEYYFRNFIKDGHIKIDNYSQEILLLNSIFTDAMLYNYNCPLKCKLSDDFKELSLIYETKEVTYTYNQTPYCIYPQGTIANNMNVTGLLSQNISALLYRNSFYRYNNGTYAPTWSDGTHASYGSLPGQSNYNSSAAIVKNQFNNYGQSFRTVNNDQLPTNPTPQKNSLATSIDNGTIDTEDKYITYFKLRA